MVTTRKLREVPSDHYNVFAKECPARMVLDRIGDKWALLILDHLKSGKTRFNELKRSVGGISQKVLSGVLKTLERDGLIYREVYPTVPVTVEYSLTPLGETLTEAISAVTHWAELHMKEILSAREAYDLKV
ncbi:MULTISPECIES: winged helix-turn-helix transcriptional regulator [Acetobacter]|uniref:Helix-turn-helix domain-containing protein n=1 Tax=Acetobacter thailandicus TaxID=1502842 RepID=A0ABT3QDW5_9PROT|nr:MULTISPECIES: helix-turn-helix domain-containing protein [Acetobacter]MCX2563478.1 helix-turn-helix domain-containing protein [Acetobacter thailandicus]NHN94231.1 transcriptional regulator [Acetobacter thailandicus]OUI89500.1 HxlR family transcriptional regulator [Acetobacter sp. DmW_043]OUJ10562.1 HxlR family transcriptional regulator [Acetobacter sp. DsW_059]